MIGGAFADMWNDRNRSWWWRPMIVGVALFIALPLAALVSIAADDARGRS